MSKNQYRPKEEIVVSVALAPFQKGTTARSTKKMSSCWPARVGLTSTARRLMNLAMELRKCCNHPFLLKGCRRQEEARLTGQTETPKDWSALAASSSSSTNCFPDCSRKAIGKF